ncbi:MAG: endonuclease/exonuclease/phosphatase family protein [Flavobacteriales bacterium]|nr:endonuclease/exonuclease/phosphatase family protein [Flavobacteriales bacterium]
MVKKIAHYLIYTLNIIVVIGLLSAYLASYVSPKTTVLFAYFGLAYPIFLIANIGFAIYWGINRKKKALLSLLVIALGWNQFFQFFQFPFGSQDLSEDSIKVMSYNVRLFDLYDWTKEKDIKKKIIELVKQQNPDVVCFQEYYMKGDGKDLAQSLNLPYMNQYFTSQTVKQGINTGIGTAIFSQYPILNQGAILFEGEAANHSTFIDILKGQDTIRIYNAHLGSIRFDYDDYTFIAGEQQKGLEEDIAPLKKVAIRLEKGFQKRVDQVAKLKEHVETSPYPTIIASDMNDTPISYTYQQFSQGLKDSFNENGSWVGSTYIGNIPFLRIDYLWYNQLVENHSFYTINKVYSDHRPIVGTYYIPTK